MDHQTYDSSVLKYDQAYLVVDNLFNHAVRLYNASSQCYKCAPQFLDVIHQGTKKPFIVSTKYPTILKFVGENLNYTTVYNFEQHGKYGINITNSPELYVITPPDDIYSSMKNILVTVVITFVLCVLFGRILRFFNIMPRRFRSVVVITDAENDLGTPRFDAANLLHESNIRERTLSVDTFRGFTMTLMLFVNYGGGKYWIFQHSPWNGLTIADLVFPWFAWIMGVSLILSISSQIRNSVPRKKILRKVFLRSLALIAIGIILNSFNKNDLRTLRLPGVLQRLGLSYFIVASLEALLLYSQDSYRFIGRIHILTDVRCCWAQWIIMLNILAYHTLVTFSVQVPGCPKGYIGPGGLHDYGTAQNCTGGVAGYIDRMIFQSQHIYGHPTSAAIYLSREAYDPEGLLGTLTTSFTVFLGVHAGRILIFFNTSKDRNCRWLMWGFFTGILALALSLCSQENGYIPINKNLWSLSFVMATSSLAFIMMSIFYFTIDCMKWWNGSPFQEVGKNSLLIYIGSIITKMTIPWNWTPISNYNHSFFLYMNCWSTILWLIIAFYLNKSNVIFTL